ncbi:hypothetical protein LIER_20102 [Lithospermum erythrorhizon]|uniref:F-box domain-containing protein n=1 Tax=Lithospermum erythrorhizon TaxID=34254 RepID=A0AAV3QK80_LITER
MESSPLNLLPQDTLHLIFSNLPLRQIIISKSVCKFLHTTLSSASFQRLFAATQPPLHLLALRSSHRHSTTSSSSPPSFYAFDPKIKKWLNFTLSFLPFSSIQPITASLGLLYLWADFGTNPSFNFDFVKNPNRNLGFSTNPNQNLDFAKNPRQNLDFSTNPSQNIDFAKNKIQNLDFSTRQSRNFDIATGPSCNFDVSTNKSLNFDVVAKPSLNVCKNKVLVVCNPLTKEYRVLPQLGSAWSRHGSVLVGGGEDTGLCEVLLVTELALLYYSGGKSSGSDSWQKFSSNLPSKPRSPIRIGELVFSLCDVGSPWRSQWKLFMCNTNSLRSVNQWVRVERHEWGDIFDILKRPRLIPGPKDKLFMIGGLKSSYALQSACTTILILRLDLDSMEWDEAGRMPVEMYRFFQESSKFKVFGGGNLVCFSAKRVGRLALWDCEEGNGGNWKWIEGVPGNGDGLYRGFVFDAMLNAVL